MKHIAVVAGLSAFLIGSPAVGRSACTLRDPRANLHAQGFTGALNDGGDTIRCLGTWRGRGHTFTAYWYEHINPTGARHTIRSVLVFEGGDYLGRYIVFPYKPRMRGRLIVFLDAPASRGNKIALSDDGPPRRAWIDGENPEFAK
jgi:hypothetical protein